MPYPGQQQQAGGYPPMNSHMFGEPTPPHMPSGNQSPMLPGPLDSKHEPYPYHPNYASQAPVWQGHHPSSLMDEENMYGGPPGVPPMGPSGMGAHGHNGMLNTPQN